VTSRVDYCNAVLAGFPRFTTDKLQRVMNSAARVVSDTRKFDSGLSRLLHDELHWLDVTDQVRFKLAVLMYRSLHGTAPLYRYLVNSCTPTADVAGRQHLRSASQRKLIVPRYRLNSFGHRCFAVAGLSTWNLLPDSLHDPALTCLGKILTRCTQRIRGLLIMCYINLHFAYLLTYFWITGQLFTVHDWHAFLHKCTSFFLYKFLHQIECGSILQKFVRKVAWNCIKFWHKKLVIVCCTSLLCVCHIVSCHIVDLKRQNRLKVGTNKPKLKVKMQSVSDDDVRKSLREKPRFELAAKGVFRLGRCYIFWHGVPGLWASNWESMATDGWLLDRWYQKTIGACRTKRPSAGKTAYWHERSRVWRCTSSGIKLVSK